MHAQRGWSAVLFALLVTGTAACTGAEEGPSVSAKGVPPAAEGRDESLSGAPAAPLGEQGPDVIGDLPIIGPKVIKTARVRIEVKRGGFLDALQEATTVAGTYGGFVVSSSVEGEKARRGSLVIRVPADRFEMALADIHNLGTVDWETVAGEDVGQEFVDLEARLRNLQAHEGVMLQLYERAQTIPESIRVQKEVTSVQLRIEEIEGHLRYLRDRAALGTISLGLVETGVVPDAPAGLIERSWQRAVDVVLAIVSAVIVSLGFIVPIGLVGLLVLPFVRRLRARMSG
jgi:uncharacterized protein DUF4349